MTAAILFCISIVAFVQFGLHYWRAMISGVAVQPVSDRLATAAGLETTTLGSRDFRAIVILRDLAPDLRGPGGSFRLIRAYYVMVEKLGRLIPSITNWSEAEMTTCSRYVAVLVDQRLERNLACAAQMRGV
jgi:hypothetical protein